MKHTPALSALPALLAIFLVVVVITAAPRAFSAEPSEETAQQTLHTIMDAIRDADYISFIKSASPSFKKAMPEDRFQRVFAEVGPVLKKGYKAEPVADYPEDGRQVFIWKIVPKAVSTELGAILVLESKTGEVASFDLQ